MDHPHYYHSHDLAKFPEMGKNRPELAQKFFDWYGAVFAEGANAFEGCFGGAESGHHGDA